MRRWHCSRSSIVGSPMPASFNAAETNRFREAPMSTGYPDRSKQIQSDEQRQIMLDAGLGESHDRGR